MTTNSDEVYGFLPNHRWSNRRIASVEKLTSPSNRSYQSLHPLEHPYGIHQNSDSNYLDTSCHSSGYSSLGSPDFNAFSIQDINKNETGSCNSQSSVSSGHYPKSLVETHAILEKRNKNCVANIPMVVIRDYAPPEHWTGKPEVAVNRGMVVNALYKVSEWVCIKTSDNIQGYIPSKCLEIFGLKYNNYTKSEPVVNLNDTCTSGFGSMTSLAAAPPLPPRGIRRSKRLQMQSDDRSFLSEHEIRVIKSMAPRQRTPLSLLSYDNSLTVHSSICKTESEDEETCSLSSSVFSRLEGPELSVLFDYRARQEGDVSVSKQETVIVLNDEDPDWIWVRTKQGQEGFIPKTYAANLRALQLDPSVKSTYF